jgi:phosphatidylserine decarboxylase
MSLVQSARIVLAPPHRAGRPFIIGGAVACLVGLLAGLGWLAWLGLIFTLFCLYFFRDPERVPPGRRTALLAPADGHVVSIAAAVPPPELGLGLAPRWRVGIFLSVLDVHVNRMPADGTVTRIAYRHGKFINASLDKASSDNERNALAIRLTDGREIAVVQIAGLIARRILCYVEPGDTLRRGQRYGFIRFGSRVDVYVPASAAPRVAVGDVVHATTTVLAELA